MYGEARICSCIWQSGGQNAEIGSRSPARRRCEADLLLVVARGANDRSWGVRCSTIWPAGGATVRHRQRDPAACRRRVRRAGGPHARGPRSRLSPALRQLLGVIASVESGQGGAAVYRVTPESASRALASGLSPADLLAELTTRSAAPAAAPE